MSKVTINRLGLTFGKIEAPDRHPLRIMLGAEGEVSIIQQHGFEDKHETLVVDIPTLEAILELAKILVAEDGSSDNAAPQ